MFNLEREALQRRAQQARSVERPEHCSPCTGGLANTLESETRTPLCGHHRNLTDDSEGACHPGRCEEDREVLKREGVQILT